MTHETLMSKIVKIFQGPTDGRTDGLTDMTTPRSSDPELKNLSHFLCRSVSPWKILTTFFFVPVSTILGAYN